MSEIDELREQIRVLATFQNDLINALEDERLLLVEMARTANEFQKATIYRIARSYWRLQQRLDHGTKFGINEATNKVEAIRE